MRPLYVLLVHCSAEVVDQGWPLAAHFIASALRTVSINATAAVALARRAIALAPAAAVGHACLGVGCARIPHGILDGGCTAHFESAIQLWEDHLRGTGALQRQWSLPYSYLDSNRVVGLLAEQGSNLGALLADLGRYEEAEAQLERALALRPASAIVLNNGGHNLMKQHRWFEAFEILCRACQVHIQTNDAAQKSWRGLLYLRAGLAGVNFCLAQGCSDAFLARTTAHLTAAIVTSPDNPSPLNNLATVRTLQHAYPDAIALLRKALELQPIDRGHVGTHEGRVNTASKAEYNIGVIAYNYEPTLNFAKHLARSQALVGRRVNRTILSGSGAKGALSLLLEDDDIKTNEGGGFVAGEWNPNGDENPNKYYRRSEPTQVGRHRCFVIEYQNVSIQPQPGTHAIYDSSNIFVPSTGIFTPLSSFCAPSTPACLRDEQDRSAGDAGEVLFVPVMASTLQMSCHTNYYHLVESFVRLLLLLERSPQPLCMPLLLPAFPRLHHITIDVLELLHLTSAGEAPPPTLSEALSRGLLGLVSPTPILYTGSPSDQEVLGRMKVGRLLVGDWAWLPSRPDRGSGRPPGVQMWLPAQGLRLIRQRLLRPLLRAPRSAASVGLLYIARGEKDSSGPKRTLVNEGEVKEAFLALSKDILHVVCEGGDTHNLLFSVDIFSSTQNAARPQYSLRDTMRRFREAKLVVGVHGAGLANIVFCSAGTTVLEVPMDTGAHHDMYAHAAEALGLEYWQTEERIPAQLFSQPFYIPDEVLIRAVRMIARKMTCDGAIGIRTES